MPYSQDPNLPCGCTNAEIDRHNGSDEDEEDCDECEGGRIVVDGEEQGCPKCEGTGYITYSISERREDAREEAAIDRWEDRRHGGQD